jgi:hypothetical protein
MLAQLTAASVSIFAFVDAALMAPLSDRELVPGSDPFSLTRFRRLRASGLLQIELSEVAQRRSAGTAVTGDQSQRIQIAYAILQAQLPRPIRLILMG